MSENLFFGDLLKQFRKRRKLNQSQLAKQIEVKRETVSLWERGQYKPEADRILYRLVDVLGLTTQEQQQLFKAYTVTALATSFHNPPLKRNPYFTGRSSQLNQLHTLLMAGKQVALTQAISGLGGIGKTHLALEYAYRHRRSYHDIFWVRADTEESLMASYVQLAGLLHLPEYEEPDQNKAKEAVQRWLRKHTGWLLILDNMEDLNLLQQFVPVNRQGAVLLTTRRHVTEPVAQALELELLPENDAILFLLKRTKVIAVDMSLKDASDHDIEMARAITQLLGNLPLALDQAGAYILETQCSFTDYPVLFKRYQGQLLRRRIGKGIPTDHPKSVAATFRLNFQQVQQRSEIAGELLRVCAFLASDGIGEEIFVKGASELGTVLQSLSSDGFLLNQAIEVLSTFSLIQRNSQEKTFSIHRLVQAVLQDALEEAEKQLWAERAVLAVNDAFPRTEYSTWLQCERLLPHALLAAQYIKKQQNIATNAGRLLHETASYLQDRARYSEAEPLFQQALEIRERQLGSEHPDTVQSLNCLAILYTEQGRYAEAEPLYQQALTIWEQRSGEMSPQVAILLNNLAELSYQQGRYARAEPLYQRALKVWEQLGFDHPDAAQPLNNLADLYAEQGRYAEAELLYQQALAIWMQQLGETHPDVTYPLSGLADLYREQGRYAEAEPLYQRALKVWERLEFEHPLVAFLINGLADLYREQGRYAEAEPLYQQALYIFEKQLGKTHPDVAHPLHGLANLYAKQGKYAEAELLYRQALSLREQLGPEHPKTAETMQSLARILEAQSNS